MIETAKVGHVTFTITKQLALARDIEACGITGPETQTIVIDDALGPDVERETVLHELMHAMWYSTLLDRKFKDEQEEDVIYSLSPCLLSLLKDNPRLVEYLLEETR